MKPLQHAQIFAKTYGGKWTDYIEIHTFLDSGKASSAHFKHRFLLHHVEGIKLAVRIFGETVNNGENREISTKQLLTEHLIEDVGRIVTIKDWAKDLIPIKSESFYKFLAKKREQIEIGEIKGERELFEALNLQKKDIISIKRFLAFPLEKSTHPAALLFSHNSFAIFLAERIFGYAFVKNAKEANEVGSKKRLIAVREVFERLIFLRLKAVYSPAEIIARTNESDWMRGIDARGAKAEKKTVGGNLRKIGIFSGTN